MTIIVCKEGSIHKQNFIHIRAMTTSSMLAELTITIRNASLLDRVLRPLEWMREFKLPPTSTRCAVVFF